MGIFQSIFKRRAQSAIQPSNIRDYNTSNYYTDNETTAWSCIDRISTTFAGLSYGVYDSKTHQKVENHWLYDLLKYPNIEDTHSLFFSEMIHDYYNGNVYLYKYFDANGNIISLFRLNPKSVYVTRDPQTNRKLYNYNGNTYTSDRILHIPSRWGYNGLTGKSIFDECSTSFRTALDLESYTNNTFNNQTGKRLVLDISKVKPNADDPTKEKARQKYMQEYGGIKNAGKPIVSAGDLSFSTIDTGIADNRSTQLTENREFQRNLMAEIFGVPSSFMTGSLNGDLEGENTIFLSFALQPLTQQFSEAFQNLLNITERDRYYIEFNFNSVQKVSLSNRIDAYTKQLNNGILSPNEIRAKENLAPVEAGNYNFIPANLMPLTESNIKAYMAQSKATAAAAEKADKEGTQTGAGSDKR